MRFIKKVSYLLFILFVLVSWIVCAWDISNILKISPNISTWMYYCNSTLTTNVDYVATEYAGFEFNIKFDTWALVLSHVSTNSDFSFDVSNSVVGNNYYARWTLPVNSSADKWATAFNIKPILVAPYQTTGILNFVTSTWASPYFSSWNAADGINITYAGKDSLSGVESALLNFVAYPCIDDTDAPIVYSNSWSPTAINWWQLTGNQNINMLVVDWTGSNSHYWYSWLDNTNLSNYKLVVSSDYVDNQYWVDSWSLSVMIDNNWSVESPTLNINVYTWTFFPNKWTWDSKDRWYWVSFVNTSPFEVEKQVTITITWYDNPNYSSTTHNMDVDFVFNTPEKPTISMVTPLDWATFQSTNISLLKFQTNDSWAGVDTWSVKIEIPAIYSGVSLLMTWHIYSGSELTFSLNHWAIWTGNSGWYEISLAPLWDFPSATWIAVSWFVADLAANAVNLSTNNRSEQRSFETRPSCSFYGCNEILDIYIIWWSSYQFTWELLIATGTNPNSPYPYLTWIDNNILMCGLPYTGTNITSNFDMYDVDWTTQLSLPHLYTWNKLYITGLDFTYSNGVITVN